MLKTARLHTFQGTISRLRQWKAKLCLLQLSPPFQGLRTHKLKEEMVKDTGAKPQE
jgi:hypothetical protein